MNTNSTNLLIKLLLVPLIIVLSICTVIIANAVTGNQILINNNIQSADSFGKYNDTEYTSFYNVRNLFDNQTNTWSFWSQYGKSGFNVNLQNPIPNPICSIDIGVYNPQNTPYSFKMENETTLAQLNGNLETTNEQISVENCIKGVNSISMTFDAPQKWTTLSEVKLFTNGSIIIEPPVCPPGTHPENGVCVPDVIIPPVPSNVTSISITNSTVLANVTDSKVILNISDDSQVITNNAKIPNDEDEEEEEEDDNNEDEEEEDEKKQKSKEGDNKN